MNKLRNKNLAPVGVYDETEPITMYYDGTGFGCAFYCTEDAPFDTFLFRIIESDGTTYTYDVTLEDLSFEHERVVPGTFAIELSEPWKYKYIVYFETWTYDWNVPDAGGAVGDLSIYMDILRRCPQMTMFYIISDSEAQPRTNSITGILNPSCIPAQLIEFGFAANEQLITNFKVIDLPKKLQKLQLQDLGGKFVGTFAEMGEHMPDMYMYWLGGAFAYFTGDIKDWWPALWRGHYESWNSRTQPNIVMTGNTKDMRTDITYCTLNFEYAPNSNITVDLGRQPNGVAFLYFYYTPVTIVYDTDRTADSIMQYMRFEGGVLSQDEVNAICNWGYANRTRFKTTQSRVSFITKGSPAPTGTYTNQTPPTTPYAKLYKLVNDPAPAEGFKKWTFTRS